MGNPGAQHEEVPDVAMLEEALQPDMFDRLRELQSFRDYEAKVMAEIEAKLKAEAEAETGERLQAHAAALAERARAEAAMEAERTRADAAEAAERARTQAAMEAERARVDSTADALIQFFALRDDGPAPYVISQIRGCRESAVLSSWLLRAYRGEMSTQIFQEP